MSYTPTNWKAGDIVTSAKLNKIEQGVAASGELVMPTYTTSDWETFTCNMTFSEIASAIADHKCIACAIVNNNGPDWIFYAYEVYDEGIRFKDVDISRQETADMLILSLISHTANDEIQYSENAVPIGIPGSGTIGGDLK